MSTCLLLATVPFLCVGIILGLTIGLYTGNMQRYYMKAAISSLVNALNEILEDGVVDKNELSRLVLKMRAYQDYAKKK